MLSQATILAQQQILNNWLEASATIYSPNITDDGYGVKTPGFAAEQTNVPVKAQTATRVPKTGQDAKALSVLTDWRMVFPVGTVVKVGWRIGILDRMFDVEDVDNLSPDIASVVCFCFDIQR